MLPKVAEHLVRDHVTNEDVRRKLQAATGNYDEHLTFVRKGLATKRILEKSSMVLQH